MQGKPTMKFTRNDSNLVYSTGTGRMCPACGKPTQACMCRELAEKKIIRGDGTIRIGRETKGRKGKGVTVITATQKKMRFRRDRKKWLH
jgi:translation initiation factor 1